MKKIIITIAIIILLLIIGTLLLVVFLDRENDIVELIDREKTEISQISDNGEEIEKLIIEAYYKDGSIFCEAIKSNETYFLFIKKDNILIHGEGEENYILIKDKKFYDWNTREKIGTKRNKVEGEIDEILEFVIREYKVNCERVDIEDDVFKLPEDVLFEEITDFKSRSVIQEREYSNIRAYMASLRAHVELYYSENSKSYEGACLYEVGEKNLINYIEEMIEEGTVTGTVTCLTSVDKYCILVNLIDQEDICIDHTGVMSNYSYCIDYTCSE